jgi:hypothetical protein
LSSDNVDTDEFRRRCRPVAAGRAGDGRVNHGKALGLKRHTSDVLDVTPKVFP